MTSSHEDLKQRFLAAITQGCRWEERWRLFIRHPWYLATLQTQARRILRRQHLPISWCEDVQQDAILLLARSLRHRADLGIDMQQVHQRFAGWMGTIIVRDCQEAIRLMRRQFVREKTIPEADPLGLSLLPLDAKIDVSMAIQKMQDPERTMLTLWSEGLSVADIAQRLKLSYHRAHYLWRRAIGQLRALLGDSYQAKRIG